MTTQSAPSEFDPQFTRSASFFERFYTCRDTMGYMTRGFSIAASFNRKVNDVLLSNALRRLMLKQPELTLNAFRRNANLGDGTENPNPSSEDAKQNGNNFIVRPVKRIVFDQVVQHRKFNAQQAASSGLSADIFEGISLVRTPVDVEMPSWRMVVFDSGDENDGGGEENPTGKSSPQYIAFYCNHVFFDGKSIVNFFTDLARELASLTCSQHGASGHNGDSDVLHIADVLFDFEQDKNELIKNSPVGSKLCPTDKAIESPQSSSSNNQNNQTDSATTVISSSSLLPKASDNITTLYNPSLLFKSRIIGWHFLIPNFVKRIVDAYHPQTAALSKYPLLNISPMTVPNKSKIVKLFLTPEELAAAIGRCKANGVTMTPFIGGCAYTALEKVFKPLVQSLNAKFNKPTTATNRNNTSATTPPPDDAVVSRFAFETPNANCDTPSYDFGLVICGRRYFPDQTEHTRYGLYASNTPFPISPKPSSSKGGASSASLTTSEASQCLAKSLKRALDSREAFHMAGMLKFVNIWDYFASQHNSGAARKTVEVSNLGVVDIKCSGNGESDSVEWKAKDIIFSQGVSSTLISISTVAVKGRGLNIIIAFHDSVDAFAERAEECHRVEPEGSASQPSAACYPLVPFVSVCSSLSAAGASLLKKFACVLKEEMTASASGVRV